jgi:hypothetical protein
MVSKQCLTADRDGRQVLASSCGISFEIGKSLRAPSSISLLITLFQEICLCVNSVKCHTAVVVVVGWPPMTNLRPLLDEYSKSMHGELCRKALLGYITSTTIPEHPKQNLVTYMEEFQSCYREYNELAPNSAAKMTPEAFVYFLYCYCQCVPSIKKLQEKNHWDKYRDSQNSEW